MVRKSAHYGVQKTQLKDESSQIIKRESGNRILAKRERSPELFHHDLQHCLTRSPALIVLRRDIQSDKEYVQKGRREWGGEGRRRVSFSVIQFSVVYCVVS
jgi:hypothetical protein